MARRYLVDPLPAPGASALQGPLSHHLAHVMRVRVGDRVVCFDGRGNECELAIVGIERGEVHVEAGEVRSVWREPRLALEVAVALPKGNRAEWIFEHGTEVGIAVFRPLVCARSQERGPGRSARWRRIVAAATTQCDRARVPEVHEEVPFAALWSLPDLPTARWIGGSAGSPCPRGAAGRGLLVVGPEGGFTAEEVALARGAGCQEVTFSELTFRTETAAVVGAALLLAP